MYVCSVSKSCLTLQPHGLWSSRFHCPCYFPGKNTGVGCYFLLQGIFPIQGLNPHLLHLLYWQADYCTTWESLIQKYYPVKYQYIQNVKINIHCTNVTQGFSEPRLKRDFIILFFEFPVLKLFYFVPHPPHFSFLTRRCFHY